MTDGSDEGLADGTLLGDALSVTVGSDEGTAEGKLLGGSLAVAEGSGLGISPLRPKTTTSSRYTSSSLSELGLRKMGVD